MTNARPDDMMGRMRKVAVLSFVSSLVIWLVGCSYDPVAVCEDRCERAKSEGCQSSETDCDNACVLADDVYETGRQLAEDAGCVAEYENVVSCYDSTPVCASPDVIAERCAEETIALARCVPSDDE
jgi:hypothetical protein